MLTSQHIIFFFKKLPQFYDETHHIVGVWEAKTAVRITLLAIIDRSSTGILFVAYVGTGLFES